MSKETVTCCEEPVALAPTGDENSSEMKQKEKGEAVSEADTRNGDNGTQCENELTIPEITCKDSIVKGNEVSSETREEVIHTTKEERTSKSEAGVFSEVSGAENKLAKMLEVEDKDKFEECVVSNVPEVDVCKDGVVECVVGDGHEMDGWNGGVDEWNGGMDGWNGGVEECMVTGSDIVGCKVGDNGISEGENHNIVSSKMGGDTVMEDVGIMHDEAEPMTSSNIEDGDVIDSQVVIAGGVSTLSEVADKGVMEHGALLMEKGDGGGDAKSADVESEGVMPGVGGEVAMDEGESREIDKVSSNIEECEPVRVVLEVEGKETMSSDEKEGMKENNCISEKKEFMKEDDCVSEAMDSDEKEVTKDGDCDSMEGNDKSADQLVEACENELTGATGGRNSLEFTKKENTPMFVGNSPMEGDSSRESTPKVGVVLTEAMVEEEKRLKDGKSRESSMESDQVQDLRSMVEQQRYLRLQHLLKQSNIYSKFLLKRMEDQRKVQEEKNQAKKNRRKKIAQTGEPISPSGRVTRLSTKSSPSASTVASNTASPPKKKARGRKRGKKRKADAESNFDISDFMDNQGKLKQMKLDFESAEGKVATPSTSALVDVEEEGEERYFNGKLIPFNQPKLVTGGIMRSYQLDGMEWIKSLYENGVNGILGDEMGLGKTLQCIGFIAYMIEKGVKGPFLVAAPLSTVPNWVAEFKRFTPTIPVVLYHGSAPEREEIRRSMFANTRVSRFRYRSKSKPKVKSPAKEPLLPVVITSYEICMRDQRYLEARNWKFLVVDEGHRIKNLNCKLIRALKAYDASNRLLLTGTPLQNNLSELWSLLNFLLPNIFNDLNSFQSWFDFDVAGDEVKEKIIAQEREQHVLATLHQILTPFLLRRLKTDVEFSLPPKKEVLVYAPLTTYQEKYYKSLLDKTIFDMMEEERKKKMKASGKGKENCLEEKGNGRLRKRKRTPESTTCYSALNDEQFESLLSGDMELREDKTETVKKEEVKMSAVDIKMTSVFMMLRKCCNHPYLLEFPLTQSGEFLVDEQLVTCCGKMMLLDRMLTALIQQGHKTLIFSQFTSMLDILEDYLELRGLVFSRLDGKMAFSERERQMTMFRESPDCIVFLLSTRAGGLGINLTSADTVIIYDSDWNPQADLQAQDRCHRIGQTQAVMVYRLVTANTIDQRIVERAATKRRLEKMVIHKGKFKGVSSKFNDLSIDDLIDLLHSVDHERVVSSNSAVISDKALEALLDRSLQNDKEVNKKDQDIVSTSSEHSSVFKVIAERDSHGNVTIGEANASTDTTVSSSNDPSISSSSKSIGSSVTPEPEQDSHAIIGEPNASSDITVSSNGASSSSPNSVSPEPTSSDTLSSHSSSSLCSSVSLTGDSQSMEVDADTHIRPTSPDFTQTTSSPDPNPDFTIHTPMAVESTV